MAAARANRLIDETSPYLLQHAHNPVDWYPWGEEALARARAEDKPIVLSIGYSACHWCHVMEHESFEDEATAAQMNEAFVSIKVDREERPDLDAIYMEAVQAITGQGGWPMTVFLTPEGQPFYGGTYYPPEDRHGLPGFRRVLASVAAAYRGRRDEVRQSAAALTADLGRAITAAEDGALDGTILDGAVRALAQSFDGDHGGLQGAPKFPQPSHWEFLLRAYRRTGAAPTRAMVERTLTAMARGGIYDQVGGGFHRYSVDERWLVPHFEKMLYDNAQLASLYLHAYQLTGRPLYRRVVEETLDYVMREMTAPEGGFYASQDADSAGHEGAFFVWTPEEVRAALAEGGLGAANAALLATYFAVTARGNFEGKTILSVPREPEAVAAEAGVTPEHLEEVVARGRQALYAVRERRVKPGRDEKVLAGWNGLMVRAFAEAATALERDDFQRAAVAGAEFLLRHLRGDDGRMRRVYKDGRARLNGYLEDYAFVADGLLALYAATFDQRYYRAARDLALAMLEHFWDGEGAAFYTTSDDHEALITRPKDLFDNAVPAGNSIAVDVLLRLAAYTGDDRFAEPAARLLRAVAAPMARYPTAFTRLLGGLESYLHPPVEVAVIGARDAAATRDLLRAVSGRYLPGAAVALGAAPDDAAAREIPLLAGRAMVGEQATAYVCRRFACQLPVTEAEALGRQLDEEHAGHAV